MVKYRHEAFLIWGISPRVRDSMNSKVVIAGAIVGLVVACAIVGVALSSSSNGPVQQPTATADTSSSAALSQARQPVATEVALSAPSQNTTGQQATTCKIHGYVISTLGEGLPGLTVTLHVIGGQGGRMAELYNMTTVTNDKPAVGEYSFDNVVIPPGTKYAYAETSKVVGDITSMGRTNNYSLNASDNLSMSIVLKLPQ
jgi:hypothetical protein